MLKNRTVLIGLVGAHHLRQTWRNHGPRDRCCTCGASVEGAVDDVHCPRCGEWPNRTRSPWACWRLFSSKASPLRRLVTGVGRVSIRRAHDAATDNRYTRTRAERLELQETCPKCGYDLHRNTSPNCPECGYERRFVARA